MTYEALCWWVVFLEIKKREEEIESDRTPSGPVTPTRAAVVSQMYNQWLRAEDGETRAAQGLGTWLSRRASFKRGSVVGRSNDSRGRADENSPSVRADRLEVLEEACVGAVRNDAQGARDEVERGKGNMGEGRSLALFDLNFEGTARRGL
jgi:hypothetical protein